jgi:branched-chain amino acid transport system permease protein
MLVAASRARSRFQYRAWPFAAIAICAAVATLAATSRLLSDYVSGLLVQSFLFGLVALITDVIWGYAGILTFASAAMFGIGAYAVGIMIAHVPTLAAAVTLAAMVAALVAAALSAVVGWLAFYSRTRVSEFYVAVVTLGLSVLFGQMVLYGGALTGGSNGLSGFAIVDLSNRSWYLLTGFALIGAIFGAMKFVRSDFGLLLRALRDHEQRCRYLGIHAPYVKTVVFTAGNAVVALVGVFYALFTTVVAPSLVGITLATNVLIWVILGGRATIVGPVIAAVLVNAATPQLSTSMPLYWQGVLGLSFILVVVLLPRGLLPGIGLGLWRLLWSVSPGWRRSNSDFDGAYSAPLFETREDGKKVLGSDALLDVRGVSKSFGSFHALSNVNLQVRPGELISIVGPNGAGKTSLVRCISDGIERDSGAIAICGHAIGRSAPDAIVGLGLGRKFQGASVFGSLTVRESLKLAVWGGQLPSVWRRDSQLVLPPGAAEVVNALGLKAVWDLPAKDISHGQRQALELAMVLALQPKVLLLDEPTAGLSTAERGLVGDLLVKLADTGQLAIVLIEHDFEFVKRISSRIVVLVGGKLVADGGVAEISESKLVRDAYLGASAAESES